MGAESIYTDYTDDSSRYYYKPRRDFHSFDGDTLSFAETVDLSVTECNHEGMEWKPLVKDWLVLTCVSILTLMEAFDTTMVIPIIPGLSSALEEPLGSALWLSTSYLLASTAGQAFSSMLAEIIGHGPLLLAAVVLSTIGTGVCGGAQQLPELVAGRFIQGIGGGGVTSISLLCLAENIPDRHLFRFSGYVAQMRLVGTVLGPVMGSLISEYIAWRGAFYSSFVCCALGMLVIPFAVDLRGRRGTSPRKLLEMDWLGAVLTLLGTGCLLIGISWGGTSYPWNDWQVLTPLTLGVSAIVILGLHEVYVATQPFYVMREFRNLPILMIYTGSFLHGFTILYQFQNLTTYFIFVRLLPPSLTGLSLICMPALALPTFILIGKLRILDRCNLLPWIVRIGWTLITLTTGCLVVLTPATPTANWVSILIAAGIGHGSLIAGYHFCLPPAPVSREYDDDQEERSVNPTSALLMCSLFRTLGMCIATTVSGAIFLNHMSAELKGRFLGGGGASLAPGQGGVLDSACTASLQFLWLVLTGVASLGGVSSLFIRATR